MLLPVNASIVGWAFDGTLRFRRWKRNRALSRRCHRSLATSQAMHGDAVKARPGREKTKWRCRQGSLWLVRFDPEDSIPRIGCFLRALIRAPSPNTAERSQSINGHQSQKRNFGRQSSISCVVKSWDGKRRTGRLSKKIQIEFVSKGSWTSDAVGEETKNRALAQASFREEIIINQSQRNAKSKYGIWMLREESE